MRTTAMRRWVIAIPLMVGLACAGGEQADEGEMDQMGGADMSVVAMPDTTAEALWAHLESANYETWALWPQKGRLYSGGEPHGMLLTTYLNDAALEALNGAATTMPAGAIIVKENYMPDSTLAAVTVMYKTAGFNREHNNWFFLKRTAAGEIQVSGRGEGCQSCHGSRADNDYLMTADLN